MSVYCVCGWPGIYIYGNLEKHADNAKAVEARCIPYQVVAVYL